MAGKVLNIKGCSPLKLRNGLTGNYYAICHYSYNLPLGAIKNRPDIHITYLKLKIMDHKIRIKIGSIEIEYEGTENYLKNDLPELIDKLVSLNLPNVNEKESTTDSASKIDDKTTNAAIQFSSNTISAKLGVKSGTDLIIAACAHLTFVQNKETFQRKDILTEMQTANNYYKNSYSANLTPYLKSLVNTHKLIERTKDTYALNATEKNRIKSVLNVD